MADLIVGRVDQRQMRPAEQEEEEEEEDAYINDEITDMDLDDSGQGKLTSY